MTAPHRLPAYAPETWSLLPTRRPDLYQRPALDQSASEARDYTRTEAVLRPRALHVNPFHQSLKRPSRGTFLDPHDGACIDHGSRGRWTLREDFESEASVRYPHVAPSCLHYAGVRHGF